MKEGRIVLIEWEDASFNNGYYDKDTPQEFNVIINKTVGHLIKLDRVKVITSVDKWGDRGDKEAVFRHISTIPRRMIKSMKYLE